MMGEKEGMTEDEKSASGRDVEVLPNATEYSIDPEVEKRVLRKIDMFVMPMVRRLHGNQTRIILTILSQMCLVFFTQCKLVNQQ
jgi:hypothetical protein